jgi:hypothetical protein
MKKRITTAREQFDMLSPWMITADSTALLERPVEAAPESVSAEAIPMEQLAPPPQRKMVGQPGEPLVGANGPNLNSKDPINDPMGKLNNQRYSYKDMVSNIVSHFNGANEDQHRRGRFWYRDALNSFSEIAKQKGISLDRAVGIGAAFSPLTDWDINLKHAEDFINSYNHNDPDFNEKDWEIAHLHPKALQAFRDSAGRDPSGSDEDIEALANMHEGLFKNGPGLDDPNTRAKWSDSIRHHGMEKVLKDHEGQAFQNRLKRDKDKNLIGYNPVSAMRDYGIPTLGGNITRAKMVAEAQEDPELFYELLKGPKVGNFSQNILDDTEIDEDGYYAHPNGDWTQHADLGGTIDAHHMRASTMADGQWERKGYSSKNGINPNNKFTYDVFNRGLLEATKQINASIEDPRKHLTPKQVQAIVWIKHKEDNDRFRRVPIMHESELDEAESLRDYGKTPLNNLLGPERPKQMGPEALEEHWGPRNNPLPEEDHRYPRRNVLRSGGKFWLAGIQDDKYPQHWMDKAEQLARDTGGFTIHDDPNTPGDAPSSGYQVAIPGYERTDINNGQGWADFAHEINPVLKGENTGLGTWHNNEDGLYYTEPSERFHDYDEGARATMDRNQWAMWDNGAFTVDPQTGEKNFLDQATIPRTDIAQQGIANSTGFTLAKNRGITYRPTALKYAKRFWEG